MAEETNQSQNDVDQFENDFQRKFKKITNPNEALEFIKQKICSIGPELETTSNFLSHHGPKDYQWEASRL